MLENAAKFDRSTTTAITVHLGRDGLVVTDRGPGIAAADAERIFDRFYRSDTARGLPGSGLGLAIVSDVATAHGGIAFARNRAGGGAELGFSIDPQRFLPASEPDRDADSSTSAAIEET